MCSTLSKAILNTNRIQIQFHELLPFLTISLVRRSAALLQWLRSSHFSALCSLSLITLLSYNNRLFAPLRERSHLLQSINDFIRSKVFTSFMTKHTNLLRRCNSARKCQAKLKLAPSQSTSASVTLSCVQMMTARSGSMAIESSNCKFEPPLLVESRTWQHPEYRS